MKLCMKWNNQFAAYHKYSKKIYMKDGISDGTILCDGRFFPIHRFILSSCSEYFEEIFDMAVHMSNKETFIIIKDIAAEQMEALLSYMYNGEADVSQESLTLLIKAAESLRIRGLGVPDEDDVEPVGTSHRKRLKSTEFEMSSPKKKKTAEKSDECSDSTSTLIPYKLLINSGVKSENDGADLEDVNKEQESLEKGDEEDHHNLSKTKKNCNNFEEDVVDDESSVEQNHMEDEREPHVCTSPSKKKIYKKPNPDNAPNDNQRKRRKTFPCSFSNCSYDTYKASNLTKHIRTHTGEKPFKCHICLSSYKSNDILKDHIRAHTGDKPFQCTLCPYKTSYKVGLRRHLKIHTGEKPFKCAECSFRCNRKGNLDIHFRTHTKGKFWCDICPFKATKKEQLEYHLETHKQEETSV